MAQCFLGLATTAGAVILMLTVPRPAYGEGAAASKYRGVAKDHTAQLLIAAKGAVIMEDDLFVGHSGDILDSKEGIHTYTVSAPGFVPRVVYTNQGKGVRNLTRTVSLLPVPDKGYESELDYKQARGFPATQKLETLPSLCATFRAAGLSFPAGLAAPCLRQTLIDDLQVIGAETIFPATPPAPASGGQSLAGLLSRLDHASDEAFYWTAEEQFAAQAASPLAANLTAYSAMRRQNCGRVMEIAMEASATKQVNFGLVMLRGLCLELAGKADKAAPVYQALVKSLPHPGIDSYYLSARGLAAASPDIALNLLQTCSEKFPYAYECFAALAQVRALTHQQAAAEQALVAYHKAAALAVRAAFGPPPLRLDSGRVAAAAQLRPYNFELAAAAMALGVGGKEQLAQAVLISDLPSLKALLPLLDRTTASDATVQAYRVVAQSYPKDPLYWVKLAEVLRRLNRCDEALGALSNALGLISDGERRAGMIVTKASCLTRLGRYSEAKKDLTAVLASGHDSWQAHYNLGIVDERLGARSEAVDEYNRALQGNLPDSVRAQIEQRLSYQDLSPPSR